MGEVPQTPLNGQKIRTQIFCQLLAETAWGQIIETGSFLGASTRLFLSTGLPVITIEANAEYYAYTQLRFLFQARVKVVWGNSKEILKRLAKNQAITGTPTFFYLDAHWEAQLPLLDEVMTIFEKFTCPAVMIDDFCIPGTGYGFDDYGNGVVLNLQYLSPAILKYNLRAFFPKAPAEFESGGRRGTLFLFTPGFSASLPPGIRGLLQRAQVES